VTWTHWHAISEKHASDAHVALHRATGSFRQAAEAETTALHQLDLGKTRTLGITAVRESLKKVSSEVAVVR
jgi:hypothetical protein